MHGVDSVTLENTLKAFVWFLPLIFAFAFLTPLIDQGLQALGVAPPFGLSTLTLALILSGGWGLFAQISGRWV